MPKMTVRYHPYILKFKIPGKTSRGTLSEKNTWFITAHEGPHLLALGECGFLETLSPDNSEQYEAKLKWACTHFDLDTQTLWEELVGFPSIQFGIEQAKLTLKNGNPFELFPSQFTKGEKTIKINGLIWMGSISSMTSQIAQKLDEGFHCLKLKIGALSFEDELQVIANLRKTFSSENLEIRLDANGAFSKAEAIERLERLSSLHIHSVEQPIKAGQPEAMAEVCEKSPIPIALDEELIGVTQLEDKRKLIDAIKPRYIILKPSLIGGFRGSEEWIRVAEAQHVDWWATSALESNIGLNAIAQWIFLKKTTKPQGLGTGGLFSNNIPSPLKLHGDLLGYEPSNLPKLDLFL